MKEGRNIFILLNDMAVCHLRIGLFSPKRRSNIPEIN